MKKLFGVMLSMALVAYGVFACVPAKAASVKKLFMKVGDTKKLNLWKNNNAYKVSGKKYVKVTKSGKVKAMKKGTATITVKHGKKIKKYKITVKDVYFSVDYSGVTKAEITNLLYGDRVNLDKEHLYIVKNALKEKNLVKAIIPNSTIPKGGGKYGIRLFNDAGEELYHIAIYADFISFHKGDKFRMKKPIDLSELDALFQ